MRRLFKIEPADETYVASYSKQFFQAQEWKLHMQPYIDAMKEAWRVVGVKYGFDPATVNGAPGKGGEFITAEEA